MNELLKKKIISGSFIEAEELVSTIDEKIFEDLVFNIAYDNENITAYSFICFLLLKKETIPLHLLALSILNYTFPHLEGAYATSLYHTKRTIELNPENIELTEMLLFFNSLPLIEKLVNDKEAKEIAVTVLKKKPDSFSALCILFGFDEAVKQKNERII